MLQIALTCADWHYNTAVAETSGEKTLGAHIGARVKKAREARGWSQSDLKRRAGVSATFVSRLEAGVYESPSPVHLTKIAAALGVRLMDLADPDAPPGDDRGPLAEALYAIGYSRDTATVVNRAVEILLPLTPRQQHQLLALMSNAVEMSDPSAPEQ